MVSLVGYVRRYVKLKKLVDAFFLLYNKKAQRKEEEECDRSLLAPPLPPSVFSLLLPLSLNDNDGRRRRRTRATTMTTDNDEDLPPSLFLSSPLFLSLPPPSWSLFGVRNLRRHTSQPHLLFFFTE